MARRAPRHSQQDAESIFGGLYGGGRNAPLSNVWAPTAGYRPDVIERSGPAPQLLHVLQALQDINVANGMGSGRVDPISQGKKKKGEPQLSAEAQAAVDHPKGGGGSSWWHSPLAGILNAVSTPAALVTSTMKEMEDAGWIPGISTSGEGNSASLSDWWNQVYHPKDRLLGSDVLSGNEEKGIHYHGPHLTIAGVDVGDNPFTNFVQDAAADPLSYVAPEALGRKAAAEKIAAKTAEDIAQVGGREAAVSAVKEGAIKSGEQAAKVEKSLDPYIAGRISAMRDAASEAITKVNKYGVNALDKAEAEKYGIEKGLKLKLPGTTKEFTLTRGGELSPLNGALSKGYNRGRSLVGDFLLGTGDRTGFMGKAIDKALGEAAVEGGGKAVKVGKLGFAIPNAENRALARGGESAYQAVRGNSIREAMMMQTNSLGERYSGWYNKAFKGLNDSQVADAFDAIAGDEIAAGRLADAGKADALAKISEVHDRIGQDLVDRGVIDKSALMKTGTYSPHPLQRDMQEAMTYAKLWAGEDTPAGARSFLENRRTLYNPKTGEVGLGMPDAEGVLGTERVTGQVGSRAEADRWAGEQLLERLKNPDIGGADGARWLREHPEFEKQVAEGKVAFFKTGREAASAYANAAARRAAQTRAGYQAYLSGFGTLRNARFGLSDEEMANLEHLLSHANNDVRGYSELAQQAREQADAAYAAAKAPTGPADASPLQTALDAAAPAEGVPSAAEAAPGLDQLNLPFDQGPPAPPAPPANADALRAEAAALRERAALPDVTRPNAPQLDPEAQAAAKREYDTVRKEVDTQREGIRKRLKQIDAQLKTLEKGGTLPAADTSRLEEQLMQLQIDRNQLARTLEEKGNMDLASAQSEQTYRNLTSGGIDTLTGEVRPMPNATPDIPFNQGDLMNAMEELGVDVNLRNAIFEGDVQAMHENPEVVDQIIAKAEEKARLRAEISPGEGPPPPPEDLKPSFEDAQVTQQAQDRLDQLDTKIERLQRRIEAGAPTRESLQAEKARLTEDYAKLTERRTQALENFKSFGNRKQAEELAGRRLQQAVAEGKTLSAEDQALYERLFPGTPTPKSALDEVLSKLGEYDPTVDVKSVKATTKGGDRLTKLERTFEDALGNKQTYEAPIRKPNNADLPDITQRNNARKVWQEQRNIEGPTGKVLPTDAAEQGATKSIDPLTGEVQFTGTHQIDPHVEAQKLRDSWLQRADSLERAAASLETTDTVPALKDYADGIALHGKEPRSAAEAVHRDLSTQADMQLDVVNQLDSNPQFEAQFDHQMQMNFDKLPENVGAPLRRETWEWKQVEREATKNGDEALAEAARLQQAANDLEAKLNLANYKSDKFTRAMTKALNDKETAAKLQDLMVRNSQDMLRYRSLAKGILTPNEMADNITFFEKLADPTQFNKFHQGWNKVVHWLKVWQIATPGFHVRNLLGGIFNNFLADVDARNYGRYAEARWGNKIASSKVKRIMEQVDELVPRASGQAISEAHLGSAAQRLGREAPDTLLGKIAQSKIGRAVIPSTHNYLPAISAHVGGEVESFLRGSLAFDVLWKGGSMEDAANAITKYHFNYADLTNFDRKVKQFIPFFTFTRNNLPLQMQMLVENPKWYSRYSFARQEIERQSSGDRNVPNYFGDVGAIRLPSQKGGGHQYLVPDLPIKDLQMATDPIDAFTNGQGGFMSRAGQAVSGPMSMVTPIVKAPIEAYLGKQFYKQIPLRDDRPVPIESYPSWLQPVVRNMPGWVKHDQAGRPYITETDAYSLDQALPMLARIRRGTSDQPKLANNRMSFLLSTLAGVQIRTNTTEQQQTTDYLNSLESKRLKSIDNYMRDYYGEPRPTNRKGRKPKQYKVK